MREAGLEDRIEIHHANALDANVSRATALYLYLVPEGMRAVAPRVSGLIADGVRVVTYIFSLAGCREDLRETRTPRPMCAVRLYRRPGASPNFTD